MKPSKITFSLGVILIVIGIYGLIQSSNLGIIIPIIIGGELIYLALSKSRVATLVFGHTCIVIGAFLITWGFLLLPSAKPTIGYIFGYPLFWGIFSMMGGICAIFHGFCNCVRKQVNNFENNNNKTPTFKV